MDLTRGTWKKSTRSSGDGQCVEVMITDEGVAVRHSKRPEAGLIVYTRAEWDAFTGGVKDGEFDL